MLTAFLLTLYHGTRWNVGQTYRRVSGVNVLTTRAA